MFREPRSNYNPARLLAQELRALKSVIKDEAENDELPCLPAPLTSQYAYRTTRWVPRCREPESGQRTFPAADQFHAVDHWK